MDFLDHMGEDSLFSFFQQVRLSYEQKTKKVEERGLPPSKRCTVFSIASALLTCICFFVNMYYLIQMSINSDCNNFTSLCVIRCYSYHRCNLR